MTQAEIGYGKRFVRLLTALPNQLEAPLPGLRNIPVF